MKVKIFYSQLFNSIEGAINRWLSKSDVDVHEIRQSESPSSDRDVWNVTISIWYKERA